MLKGRVADDVSMLSPTQETADKPKVFLLVGRKSFVHLKVTLGSEAEHNTLRSERTHRHARCIVSRNTTTFDLGETNGNMPKNGTSLFRRPKVQIGNKPSEEFRTT